MIVDAISWAENTRRTIILHIWKRQEKTNVNDEGPSPCNIRFNRIHFIITIITIEISSHSIRNVAIAFRQNICTHREIVTEQAIKGVGESRKRENGRDVFHRNRWTKSTSSSSSSSSSSISMNKEMRKYHANSQHWSKLIWMCTETSTYTYVHTPLSFGSVHWVHTYSRRIPGSIWHRNVHLSV